MKRNITTVIAAICAIACVVAVMLLKENMPEAPITADTTGETEAVTESEPAETETESEALETEPVETKPPYVSPKDFAALREKYPHIHGWLNIPGSYVDYPIIQHPTDDTFYDRTDAEGNADIKGCIYTEHVYNRTDFTDYVTVLYGHYAGKQGNYQYFGGLQEMYSPESFEEHKNITVYHQEKELRYQVWAAVKYDEEHIPWTYDFSSREEYNAFLERVKSFDGEETVFSSEVEVKAGDKLLILSTCYDGGYGANRNVRFIVIAKLVETVTE